MGCYYSKVEREEMVSRCKARKRYMKQLVKARQDLSSSHTLYLLSLRKTGSALLRFATLETNLHLQPHSPQHHHHHLPPPLPSTLPPLPPPQQPMSPSDNWTSVTSGSSPLPPPPPPPLQNSSWSFWDPFLPSSKSVNEEEEEEWETTTIASEVNTTTSISHKDTTKTEMALVVSRNTKDLVEITKELDDYFLKAANTGAHLSLILEVSNSNFTNPTTTGQDNSCEINYLSPLSWTWGLNSKPDDGFGDVGNGGSLGTSHCSTVEKLYAWEKKLYQEVKEAHSFKIEHEKSVNQQRKLEMKGGDYLKIEKIKKHIEKLESRMMVASQSMETTSSEIIRVRELELYPQLLELIKGLMGMWRSMYECHQVQAHIVQQLKFLKFGQSTEYTSEIHHQATLRLELEVQQWQLTFGNLVKSQRDYIHSLTGWLRLSLFHINESPLSATKQCDTIYSVCDQWQLELDRIPDKVASDGISVLLTVIHAIVLQQAEEHKQKKKSEAAFKELEKKVTQLRSLESKYGPYSTIGSSGSIGKGGDLVAEKRTRVETLKTKAEEEKSKYEKLVSVTRAMTINNLQMGFPNAFEAITGFSRIFMNAFESVYNQSKNADESHNMKMVLAK